MKLWRNIKRISRVKFSIGKKQNPLRIVMNFLNVIKFFVLEFFFLIPDNSNSLPHNKPSISVDTLSPDLDKDFVIFPGEDGEEIYGYFEKDVMVSMRGRGVKADGFNIFGHNYKDEVILTLYSRSHPNGSIVTQNNKNLTKYFDSTQKTKIVTHGWLSNGLSDTCVRMKNNYVKKTDYNVIIVDWSAISGNVFYPIPMEATVGVSNYLADFLNHLVANMSVNPSDLHLIGHSLGAHISGFAGRKVKGEVGRITGLDPAMPGFNMGLVKEGHLNRSDARFVDVIHTCAGYLGYKQPLGHVDFYPNGGSFPQPGCEVVKFYEACSHGMSWKIFAKSIILRKTFIASECPSLDHLTENECKGKRLPVGDPTPDDADGIYFVSTTKSVKLLQ